MAKLRCGHGHTQVEHNLLHLERAEGCDETRCLDCGEVLYRSPCQCPDQATRRKALEKARRMLGKR